MSCKYYHLVSSITVNESFVILNFNNAVTLSDENRICFKFTENIPATGDNLPVYVVANASNVPLLNKYGNPVIGSDLKKNRVYGGWYGATTPHVILPKIPLTCNFATGNVI